jgi:CxxC motif-containing protein (DUF1111 family)
MFLTLARLFPARRHFAAGVLSWGLLPVQGLAQQEPALPRHPLDAAAGQALFERHWIPAPASTAASDGLGPFYNARACATCHPGGGRGVDLQALTLRSNDPVYGRQLQALALAGLKPELSYTLSYTPTSIELPTPHHHPLEQLQVQFTSLRYGPLQSPWSARLAPSLLGVGLLQQVDASVLQALADPDDRDGDGISGRLSQMPAADGTLVAGRFGWKAELPDLLTQTASAFSLDLGLGSPLYPAAHGDCSEVQLDCLQQVPGTATGSAATEVDTELLQLVLAYLESLPPPVSRVEPAGLVLFERSGCARCHVPSLPGAAGPVSAFSDLLLHDMGQGLADAFTPEFAGAREWRTAPLWGLGSASRLLHDGRAGTIEAAILWHGGEAEVAREIFRALTLTEKRQLLDFLKGL